MTFTRRRFIHAAGAGLGTSALGYAAPVFAQSGPIRVGLVTVKTGPLASGGIDMERALVQFFKERNNTLSGRKIELIVADTGGVPAQARTKIQELVERDKIHVMIGPLDTASALAADDYIRQQKLLTLSVAAAEDMTQRKPNPWFTRGTSTSSQCSQPLADYAYKTLGYRRMVTIADDIAYGHEMCAGFQRVFEELGGKIIQKQFPPLTVPDYGTYIAGLKTNADSIFLGFAGSNGFRYVRQFNEYGLRGKVIPIGGMTALDEAVLRNMGAEAIGIHTACWYSAELENPINQKFAAEFRKQWKYDPGFYAAATYVEGAVLEATLKAIKGQIENKEAFMKAVRSLTVDTARGPVKFDSYGNVVGNIYIRRVTRKEDRLVNSVVYTYPNVSQFWKYKPDEFLKNPVYSRDYPPAKNLEPQRAHISRSMQYWTIQTLNSLSLGGLLFLLAAGFSLIFGLMRIANLTHGSMYMLGAYIGVTVLNYIPNLWIAALIGGAAMALCGGIVERLVLRRLAGNALGQVLLTLGISFIVADLCLMLWGGDPIPVPTPTSLQQPLTIAGVVFPAYRLVVIGIAVAVAIVLYVVMERTRLGAMIRAGVDDMQMARAVGIPVSRLFTIVFCLGAGLAGAGGILGGPIMSAYPGLDADMLPLALIIVILGGIGSLLGAFVGSFVIGAIYTFGVALAPDLAYVILFLPMIFVIAFRPTGLFGRQSA